MDSIQQFDTQRPTSSRTGVTVYTWGSFDGQMKHQYLPEVTNHINNIFLQSHNPGHAAVQLTLSDTPENREMVFSLLAGTEIPYKFKTYKTSNISYPMDSRNIADGTFDEASIMYTESVIEVYFSFWPSKEKGVKYNRFQQDLDSSRIGTPVAYNMDRIHQLNRDLTPEQRIQQTRLKSNFFQSSEHEIIMDFGSVFHKNVTVPALNDLLLSYQWRSTIQEKMESVNVYLEKIIQIKNNLEVNDPLNQQKIKLSKSFQHFSATYLKDFFPENIKKSIENNNISFSELHETIECLVKRKECLVEEDAWAKLNFINCMYRYLETQPLTKWQKKIDEKILILKYLREQMSKEESATNFSSLNKIIEYFNNLVENREKIDLITNVEQLEFLKKKVGKDTSIVNFGSLFNQDVRVKLQDIFGSNSANIEFVKLAAYVNSVLCQPGLFLESENNHESIASIHAQLSRLSQNNMFSAHENQFKIVLQKLVDCGEGLTEKQNINKTWIDVLRQNILHLTLICLNGVYKKSELVDDEVISDLSVQSYFIGKQPDHQIQIPTQTVIKEGLNPVAMLKEMAHFAHQKKGFDLISFNCSNATMQILAAGAGDKGWIFTQGALGTIFTPHVVYMRVREYVNELNNPLHEKPTPYFFAYKEQLDYYGNRAVKIAANKNKIMKEESMFGIIKSGADMLFSGGIALGLELAGSWVFGKQQQLHEEAMEGIKKLENYENMTPKEILRAKRLFDHKTKEVKTLKRLREDKDTTLEQETRRVEKRRCCDK